MKLKRIALALALGFLPAAWTVMAQPPESDRAGGTARQGMAQMMESKFARSSPDLGDELPDLSGYRSDGTKISLKSLRGRHAVLVFGCLT